MKKHPVFIIKSLVVLILVSASFGAKASEENTIPGVITEPQKTEMQDVLEPQPDPNAPHIVVNIAARKLYFYDQNKIVRSYPVAVGSSAYRTPIGDRFMTQIIWNPWWLPPDSGWAKGASPTPPGPNNPLGPVKMDLGNAILFHGTNKPKSIGHAASHGCMRMNSNDAREFARFIQENYTSQNDPALFEQYEKSRGRSFYVKLENPIPVQIVYEIADIRDGKLNIYKDVYYKYSKTLKQQTIEKKMIEHGLEIAKIDMQALYDLVAKNKNDIELDIEAVKSGTAFIPVGDTTTASKKVASK